METKIVDFNSLELIHSIRNKEVACFPTETVYGLGVVFSSKEAFDSLVEVKERRPDKPFTLMVSKKEDIEKYSYINNKTKKVIEEFMPGEITILVKPKENLFPWVTLNSKYIGIRISGKKEVCQLIDKVGEPLLVTSANISSYPASTNFDEAYRVFRGKVPYIVKGETSSSIPSTIVICDEELMLVRQGNIPFEKIKKVWES